MRPDGGRAPPNGRPDVGRRRSVLGAWPITAVRGSPFGRVPRMPRVPDWAVPSIVYVFPDEAAARTDDHLGGTGFLVGISGRAGDGWTHVYAITARHIAASLPTPTLRFSRPPGAIRRTDRASWLFHDDGDEVAACWLQFQAPNMGDTAWISVSLFADRGHLDLHEENPREFWLGRANPPIAVGDDVFFLGRFVALADAEGERQENVPAIRFGNISSPPVGIVQRGTGVRLESFLVEAQSRSGYSGSPVFVWPSAPVLQRMGSHNIWMVAHNDPLLLGLDHGHTDDEVPVRLRGGLAGC